MDIAVRVGQAIADALPPRGSALVSFPDLGRAALAEVLDWLESDARFIANAHNGDELQRRVDWLAAKRKEAG